MCINQGGSVASAIDPFPALHIIAWRVKSER